MHGSHHHQLQENRWFQASFGQMIPSRSCSFSASLLCPPISSLSQVPTGQLLGASGSPPHTHSSKRDSSSKHRACHFTLSGGREEASSARSHTEPSSPFTACTAVPELIPAVEGMGNVTPTQTAGLNSKDAEKLRRSG